MDWMQHLSGTISHGKEVIQMPTEPLKPVKARCRTEAIDELHREMGVRTRCFHRWVDDGKLSRTDAQDRIDRMASAIALLIEGGAAEDVPSTGDMTAHQPF